MGEPTVAEEKSRMSKLGFLSSPLTIQNPKLCSPIHYSFFSLKSAPRSSCGFNLNIGRFSLTKTFGGKLFAVKCQQSEYFEKQQRSNQNASSFSPQSSPPGVGDQSPPRVYVGHSIYKGKAALTIEPRAPEFTSLDSGAYKLSREGFVLLQFAPAAGVRVYDWGKKLVFSLSVTEIGTLVGLGARDSCEFFHDPNKGKSDEGRVRKVLKVEPLPDGSGRFFNLSVQNKLLNMDESIYIPITKAEYTVLVSAFNFILPYLIGWHAFANSSKPDVNSTTRANNVSPSYGGDYEWSR